MRTLRLLSQLIGVIALAVSCGASSPSPTAATAAPIEFRVMTFNIQHGLNGSGKYGLDAAAGAIAGLKADVVGLQELTRNHPAYNCEDQPARLAEAVGSRAGGTWHSTYQQEWFTQIRDCPQSGRGDGPATEGLGFLAPEPVPSPSFTQLWNGRLGYMTTLRRGRNVPVIVTHLAHGQENVADRSRQLDQLLAWSTNQPRANGQILMGDFNMWPDSAEYRRVREHYRDAWVDAAAAGTARGRMDGVTHNTVRIDYIFYTGDSLELLWIENVDTRSLFGSSASDHNPLIAAFRVK